MAFIYGLIGLGAMGLAGIASGLGYSLSGDKKRSELDLLFDTQPVIFNYDGDGLRTINLAELKYVTVNVTSDTTAVFGAPTWDTSISGDFWFDKTSSTASVLRGNFSFAAPPFLTISASVPTSSSALHPPQKSKAIRRSAPRVMPDDIKTDISIAAATGSLLSEVSTSRVPEAGINDAGSANGKSTIIASPPSEKRAVPQSPTVIKGHWMMYTHSPPDARKKEVFDAFYEHEMGGLTGIGEGAKLSRTGEYVDFLSEWDERCFKERFPLCCSPGGMCL